MSPRRRACTAITVAGNARYFATVYGADETAADRAIRDVGLAILGDQRRATIGR